MEEKKKKRKKKERAERKPNWKEYMATVEDIQNFIMDRLMLRHNVITRRVEYRLPSSYEHEGTDWQPITDRVVNSLWSELSLTKVVRAQDMTFDDWQDFWLDMGIRIYNAEEGFNDYK